MAVPTPMTALFLMTLVGTAAAAFFAGAHGVAGGLATARASGAFSLRAGLLCGALIGAASVALTPLDVGVGLISGFWGEPITTNPMRIAAAVAASVVATAAVLGVTAVLGFAAPVGLVLCIAMASIGAVEGGGSAVGLAGGVGALGFALVLATGAGFALTRAGQIGVFRAPRPRDRTPVSIGLGYGLTVALAGLALALALGAGLWAMVALPLAVIAGGLGYALARSGRANVANTLEAADAAHRTPQGFAALAGAACAGAGQAALLAVPARWLAELQARPEALEGGVTSLAVSASVPVSLALVGGYGFGALLLGHRVTCRLGDELAPTGPLGALGASLGVLIAALACVSLGLPAFGGVAAAAGLVGVGLASGSEGRNALGEPLARMGVAWAAAGVAAPALGLLIYGACRVLTAQGGGAS